MKTARRLSGNLKTGVRKDLGVRIPRPPYGVRTAERLNRAFDLRRSSPPWSELAVSGAATIALFLTALVSMTSISSTERSLRDERRAPTEVTFLSPPPTPVSPREKPVRPRPTLREPVPATPQIAQPVAPIPAPTASRVDTATVPAPPPARLTDITVPNDRIDFRSNSPAARSGLGSPSAPAGLTDNSRAARGASTMTSARLSVRRLGRGCPRSSALEHDERRHEDPKSPKATTSRQSSRSESEPPGIRVTFTS